MVCIHDELAHFLTQIISDPGGSGSGTQPGKNLLFNSFYVVQVQGVSLRAGVQPAGDPEAREAGPRPLAGRIPRDLQRLHGRRQDQEGSSSQAAQGGVGTRLSAITSVPDPKLIILDPDPRIENQEFRIQIQIRILL